MKLPRVVEVALVLGMLCLPPAFMVVGQTPQGGTMTVVLIAEPRVLSPYTGSWNSGFVAGQIFNSLLAIDDNMDPTLPSLATELPEINEAEGSYTFKLREGVKWHDGEPFTADDVKFTFEEMMQYDIFGALYFKDTVVEILDKSTVKITPGTYYPGVQMTLFAGLDTSILPKHILGDVVDEYLDQPFRTESPVGTGPFKFKEWVTGSHIVYEAFDDYWGEGPYLDEVVVKIIPEPATVLAAFQTGEADYVFRGMPYEAYETLVEDPNLEVYKHTRPPYKMVLDLNTIHPILSNVKVRQAIAYAVNRDAIISDATNGLCEVTDSYWTSDITAPSPERSIYTYDPTKAAQLLDEAGYSAGFEIELLMRRGEPEEALAAELLRDDLAAIGITMTIKTVDFGTFLQLESVYDYDFCMLKRWVMTFWTLQLFHSEWIIEGQFFANSIHYSNSNVDAAFDDWRLAADPAKQREYLQKAEALISHDVPEILLYDVTFINVVRKTFQPAPGAESGTLPDGRYVFWDPLNNMYWTEGTVPVPEIVLGAAMLGIGTVLVTATTALIMRRRRKSAN